MPDIKIKTSTGWVLLNGGGGGTSTPGVTVFEQAAEPTGAVPGDIWIGVLPPTISFVGSGCGPLTIYGMRFTGVTDVTVDGTTQTFTVDSDGQISCPDYTPTGVPIQSVQVTAPSGVASAVLPTISAVTQDSYVHIYGSGFTGVTAVTLDGYGATFAVVNDGQIDCPDYIFSSTPPSMPAVTVITNLGTAYSLPAPVVQGVVADYVPVVISGYGFTGATEVTLDGTSTPFTVDSDGQISCPDFALTGTPPTVGITTPWGVWPLPPHIVGVTVSGTQLDIGGSGFTGASEVHVDGNLTPATFTVDSDAILTVTDYVPTGSPPQVQIITPTGLCVWNPPAPFIDYANGDYAPLNIVGRNFTGATVVVVGGVSVTNFTVDSDNSISCPDLGGTGPAPAVTVTTPAGSVTWDGNAGMTPAAPDIKVYTPAGWWHGASQNDVTAIDARVTALSSELGFDASYLTSQLGSLSTAVAGKADLSAITEAEDRANHTGTQLASTISDFALAVVSAAPGGSGTGTVNTIVAGTNVTVDATDPANPVVSAAGATGDADWTIATILDPWSSYGTGPQAPAFRKLSDGLVLLRGRLDQVNELGPAFYLPVGYRPNGEVHFTKHYGTSSRVCSVVITGAGGAPQWGMLAVDGGLEPGGSVYLDGITFFAEA